MQPLSQPSLLGGAPEIGRPERVKGRTLLALGSLSLVWALGCATPSEPEDSNEGTLAESYLRRVGFEMPFNETILLHWPKSAMPLRVHLPAPPPELFTDPDAVLATVEAAIRAWSNVAAPGIPSFVFVETARESDIRVTWAEEPDGSWYGAYCAYDQAKLRMRHFGVDYLLISGRKSKGGSEASPQLLHAVVLHEMGHALGLGGHSPSAADVMYGSITPGFDYALSASDRLTLSELYSSPIGKRVVGAKR